MTYLYVVLKQCQFPTFNVIYEYINLGVLPLPWFTISSNTFFSKFHKLFHVCECVCVCRDKAKSIGIASIFRVQAIVSTQACCL